MQSMHRQFGRLKKRTADESQVSTLLKDFEDADMLMAKLIDASKAWRDAWTSILTYQHNLLNEFDGIYAPILGAGESYTGHQPAETPEAVVARTAKLKQEFLDLKNDMTAEAKMIDQRLIHPAMNAKDSLALMKKTIKKREDRKLDYERHSSRVESGQKKPKKSDRDIANLTKAEADLGRAQEEYHAADDNLRHTLPLLVAATYSLLPHLLANQAQIQNSFLAQTYTLLHNYCSDQGFPNPAPPMADVMRKWEDDFRSLQRETESIAILAHGKAVRMPMKLEEASGPLNGALRKTSGQATVGRLPSPGPSQGLPTPSPGAETKARIAAPVAGAAVASSPSGTSDPAPSNYQTPTGGATPFSPAAPRMDYFSRDRQAQMASASTNHSIHSSSSGNNLAASASTVAAIAAKKKRPPPPPPPPRMATANEPPAHYVTALYDFGGQGAGDLSFREGDRIKVTQQSGSKDDWWEGELRGVRGSFPANYCE